MGRKLTKSGFAFTRNPIMLRQDFPDDASVKHTGTISVSMDGTTIYEGVFSPSLSIDLSEIVDAYVRPLPEAWGLDGENALFLVEGYDDFVKRHVVVDVEFDGYDFQYWFDAMPGGISKQNFRRLHELGTDIFNERFRNFGGCNMFMITRTSGWRIVMKETELYPLYFFNEVREDQMTITDVVTGKEITYDILDYGVHALDINEVRRDFVDGHRVLPSVLDVYYQGAYCCRIVVEHTPACKERYRLLFRNSLGVFEVVELAGALTVNPEYGDEEDGMFRRYDSVTGDYCNCRERVRERMSVTVKTGFKRRDELVLFRDALASEEAYLLDYGSMPVRVIPSCEEMSYDARGEKPQQFEVKLSFVDDDANVSTVITGKADSVKPRVFSKQFSKQFN